MKMKERLGKFISIMLVFVLLLTACGDSNEVQESESNQMEETDSQEIAMGAYVETDITPPNLESAFPVAFSQGMESNYLLALYDSQSEEYKSLHFQDDTWNDMSNESINTFISENPLMEELHPTVICDFSNTWWVFAEDEGNVKGWQIVEEGPTTELEINTLSGDIAIIDIQVSETGILCLSVIEFLEESGAVYDYIFIDTKTGTVMEDDIPESVYSLHLQENTALVIDHLTSMLEVYDIKTNEKKSHEISLGDISGNDYTADKEGNLVYINNMGIHKILLNEKQNDNNNKSETIIDNAAFSFTDTNLYKMEAFADNSNRNYMTVYESEDGFKIKNYLFDENIPSEKSNILSVWAFEDNHGIRAASSVFSKAYPDWEVKLEFGKTADDSSLTNDDIIRNLNTQLLVGEAPDVLFLDGLPMEVLYQRGMLSEFELDIEQSQFHSKVLNSYSKDGVAYAYPTFFQVPVLVSSGSAKNIEELNTIENIAKLYEDPEVIYNDWSKDLFDSLYYTSFFKLFPDNQSINVEEMTEFLAQTKKMVDSQDMKNDSNYAIGESFGVSSILVQYRPSFHKFALESQTHATGVLTSLHRSRELFTQKENIEIIPLLDGNYINKMISSIPTDAKNKEMAENFIKILLTDDNVQSTNNELGFSIKKNIEMGNVKNSSWGDRANNVTVEYMDDFYAYDWEGLFDKLTTPYQEEYLLYDVVYGQARKIYDDEISINQAVSEISNQLKIIFAERR